MDIQPSVVIRCRGSRQYEIRYRRERGGVLILIPPAMWHAKGTRCQAWRSGCCVGDAADGGFCALHAWLNDIEQRLELIGQDLAELEHQQKRKAAFVLRSIRKAPRASLPLRSR